MLKKKEKKSLAFENAHRLLRGNQKLLNSLWNIFNKKQAQGKRHCVAKVSDVAKVAEVSDSKQLKMLTPKKRLPFALAQVKADNTSENLLNKFLQIIYSLYRAKEITKKVNSNIMNSIKL